MFDKALKRAMASSFVFILIATFEYFNHTALSEEDQASYGYGFDTNKINIEHVENNDGSDLSSTTINSTPIHSIDMTSLRLACGGLITDESLWDKDQLFGEERFWPNPNLSTNECRKLLVSYFSKQPVMKYILPMPKLTWFDIFNNIEKKIEAVLSTLRNHNCTIPEGTSSTVLVNQCNSGALVETAILMESCVSVHDVREIRATLGGDIYAPPGYNPHSHYRSSYDVVKRRSDLSRLNTLDVSTTEYWQRLDQIDNSFFRGAYLRMICTDNENYLLDLFNVHEETKTSSYPYVLCEIASRLRHPIAWVSYVPRGSDVPMFMLINPIQTALQHARDSELTHSNFRIHKIRWNSELVNRESSVLSGVADLKTFRSFLKQENVHCPNECDYDDMYIIFESLSEESRRTWSRFFNSIQFDKLTNDRVYWGFVADRLANELQINIDRDLLYERFIHEGLERIDPNNEVEIRSLANEKSNEIIRLRTRVLAE